MLPAISSPSLDVRPIDEDVTVMVDGVECFGILKELSLYAEPVGWTGWVTWWGSDGRHCGRFAIDEIRRVDEPGPTRTPTQ